MSILYLLVPAAAVAVSELAKKGAPAPAPALAPPAMPLKQVMPEIPDNPKTRAYAEAVAVVERWGKVPGAAPTVFNGVTRWTANQAQGQPTYPILAEKDLPAPPRGYIWREVQKNSDTSKSAYTINYWELGSPPPAASVPRTTLTPTMTPAPAAPAPPPIGGEIPDTPKTRAYRNALLLKEQAEAQARGMSVAAVAYTVPAEVLSESELPQPSQGFRWATGGMLGPTWRYIRTSEPLAPTTDWTKEIAKILAATAAPQKLVEK
jgi:hypothetical protein